MRLSSTHPRCIHVAGRFAVVFISCRSLEHQFYRNQWREHFSKYWENSCSVADCSRYINHGFVTIHAVIRERPNHDPRCWQAHQICHRKKRASHLLMICAQAASSASTCFTAASTAGCMWPFVATIPRALDNFRPRLKSSSLPIASVTLPPASLSTTAPAA